MTVFKVLLCRKVERVSGKREYNSMDSTADTLTLEQSIRVNVMLNFVAKECGI